MSHLQNKKLAAAAVVAKEIDEYECSGNGPRPPVPGKESRTTKMTEMGCPSSSTVAAAAAAVAQAPFAVPHADDILAECARVKKWREKLSNLLSDQKGVELFREFVKYEARPDDNYTIHLDFYFACEGLKQLTDPKTVRQIIGAIYRKYLRNSCNDITVPTELRNTIRKIIKNEREADANVYNEVQREVEAKITETTFPKFFQSKFYFEYSEQVQKPTASLNNNYGGSASGRSNSHYGSEMASGWTTAIDLLSPCDSLGASCSNLQESLTMNSVLPTLHEDTELTIHDDVSTKSLGGSSAQPKLTKDLLLATQTRRLEVRSHGAYGYNLSLTSSFNPVSRQDSERQSCSSASQTDSDTKSLVNSKDGQPYMHRKPSASESIKKCYMNPNTEANNTLVEPIKPITSARLDASKPMDPKEFCEKLKIKLELVKEERDKEERLQNVLNEAQKADEQPMGSKSFASSANAGFTLPHQDLTSAIWRKISPIIAIDNDQDILDRHCQRVFLSPLTQSPGTASPRQPAAISAPHRTIGPMTEFPCQSMRHPISLPEHVSCGGSMSRKADKNSTTSLYNDSGVSMNSVEFKPRDAKPISTGAPNKRKVAESIERSQMSTTSMAEHHTNSLPRVPRDHGDDCIVVVYQFCDEKVRYRTRLPKVPTLKMFKEVLHKKGNFRYFFKIPCSEPQEVQEEFTNDADILPLFDGKVMGMVTPL